jgi:FKBP-type peptidyl-prolyl cis-trans isomerase
MKIQLSALSIKGALFVLVLASTLLFSGCLNNNVEDPITPEQFLGDELKKVDQTKLASDLTVIDDSLDMWDITPQVIIEPKGVRYTIDEPGLVDGAKPTLSSIVKFKYTAKLLSTGATFDTSDNLTNKYLETYLYGLIIGFQTTMPNLRKGAKATLYIPSGYAYGTVDLKNADGLIIVPKNSNIIFEIELLDVR